MSYVIDPAVIRNGDENLTILRATRTVAAAAAVLAASDERQREAASAHVRAYNPEAAEHVGAFMIAAAYFIVRAEIDRAHARPAVWCP